MVIDFEGKRIQMPSTAAKSEKVFVKFDKKNYYFVTEDEYKKSLVRVDKKDTKKEVSDKDE